MLCGMEVLGVPILQTRKRRLTEDGLPLYGQTVKKEQDLVGVWPSPCSPDLVAVWENLGIDSWQPFQFDRVGC